MDRGWTHDGDWIIDGRIALAIQGAEEVVDIRVLTESDAEEWWHLRLQGLENDSPAFGQAPEEHRAMPMEVIRERFRDTAGGNFTLGAFEGEKLVGMMTFVRSKGVKDRHKGHIYGVFVAADQRGKGVGRKLLDALVETAKRDPSLEQIQLAVATVQTAARELYRSVGFESFGIERNALKDGSTYIHEDHMVLRVR
jgi:ribosomal protein S18 acetylase RimI-like enzyme